MFKKYILLSLLLLLLLREIHIPSTVKTIKNANINTR